MTAAARGAEQPGDRRRAASFRARLTLRFTVLMAGLFTVVGGVSVVLLRHVLVAQLDGALLRLASIEASSLTDSPTSTMHLHEGSFEPPAGEARELAPFVRYAEIWDTGGRAVLRSRSLGDRDLPTAAGTLAGALRGGVVAETGEWQGTTLRSVFVPLAPAGGSRERHVLQVSAPLAAGTAVLGVLAWGLLGVGAVATGITVAGGWALAGRAIRPARQIAEQAEAISAGSLGARIRLAPEAAEYQRLVAVLNAMLERLEGAFEAQRRFVADASHEIRHPLAVLRAALELALRRERSAVDYRTALTEGVAQADRIGALAEGLLLLARSDAGVLRPHRVVQDVALLASAACRRADLLAGRPGVRVSLAVAERQTPAAQAGTEGSTPMPADGSASFAPVNAGLIARALDNLLDNAVKAAAPGGTVRVSVVPEPDAVSVRVADDGPGIAPEHRARLFERFFRADAARAADGGAGLGLAIVRGIAEAHGGSATYEPVQPHGSEFRLRFPR